MPASGTREKQNVPPYLPFLVFQYFRTVTPTHVICGIEVYIELRGFTQKKESNFASSTVNEAEIVTQGRFKWSARTVAESDNNKIDEAT